MPKYSCVAMFVALLPVCALLLLSCGDGHVLDQARAAGVPDENRIYRLQDTVKDGFLHSDGSLWFATNHEGVYRFQDGSFEHFDERDGLASDHVSAITEDDQGRLWFGTDSGLCRFDGSGFVRVPIPWDGNEDLWGPGLNANLILCLHCDRNGDIWFGTWGNGVHRFDPSSELEADDRDVAHYAFTSFLQDRGAIYSDGSHRNAIQSISEDDDGKLWVTSMSHGGVSSFSGEAWTHFAIEDGLADDMVFSSHVDSNSDLWFGMLGNGKGGIDRFDGERFEHFTTADGMSSNNVIAILQDHTGTLWLGSQRGKLCVLEPAADPNAAPEIHAFTDSGRTFEHIHFFVEDGDGGVWFGGGYGQLFSYNDHTLTDFRQKR